jgi:uncharacterized membrane protein (DUF4010 family)
MDFHIARGFLVAMLIGALVGIDRERKKAAAPGEPSSGGIRTHILLALAGAASVRLAIDLALPWAFAAALGVVALAVVAGHVQQQREHDDPHGLTSELAAIVVFLLAAMVMAGQEELAVALGVATSALLAFKQPIHGWVRRLDTPDLLAALKLLIASFIVLPLLPDATIDPWAAINPYKLWLLVILISALSLAGYIAVRWLGSAHGAALMGLAGGLVSSTATTLAFARSSRSGGDAHALAAAILLAWLVMFARVLIVVGLVNRALLAAAWLPLVVMGVLTAAFAAAHYRIGLAGASRAGGSAVAVSNPFSLAAAARLGALFAVVLLFVALAQRHAPPGGVYLVAALAGAVDVDAITLSMAEAAGTADRLAQAGIAITIATVANTLVKCGLVVVLGAPALRVHIAAAAAVLLAGGLFALRMA